MKAEGTDVRYRVTGMDCARDAAEIEDAVRRTHGVRAVKVSVASHTMALTLEGAHADLAAIEQAVTRLGYQLDAAAPAGDGVGGEHSGTRSHITAAYKRALAIVVVLNVGYGAIEIVGGFLSGSQALKADALDFLGDGLISFLGLQAIGWTLRWRARSALIQGIFLAALGAGVLLTTAYRILAQRAPEAELMGLLGVVALVVNVVSALVLIPHRSGDANARAVWLFSRNDAIGNVAVVAAASMVAWLKSAWPDLVVALMIAGLFLHSAWSIIRDARNDLREARIASR